LEREVKERRAELQKQERRLQQKEETLDKKNDAIERKNEQIAEEYSDTVTVVAIHSALSSETAPAYIEEHYPDSPIRFSWDEGEGFTGKYYSALGGRGAYPYTIILDENGIIVKIFVSSVTYEDLKTVVDTALNG